MRSPAPALSLVVPIAFFVASLLGPSFVSYRQTVRAYPSGGGAYIVAHENLGMYPGLLATAALLIDYVLTVSVLSRRSRLNRVCFAGKIGAQDPHFDGCVVLIALANLRGAKESGTIFAIPTYGFVLSICIMLVTGSSSVSAAARAESAGTHLDVEQALILFLVLRAFAAGATALTGVEAISNGVPALRFPLSRNAVTTLGMMGAMSI